MREASDMLAQEKKLREKAADMPKRREREKQRHTQTKHKRADDDPE